MEEFPDGKNASIEARISGQISSIRLCRVSIVKLTLNRVNLRISSFPRWIKRACTIMRECSTWGQDKSHGWNFSLSSLESRQFEDGGDKCSQYRRETCVYIRYSHNFQDLCEVKSLPSRTFFQPSPPSSLDFRRLVLRYLCAPVIHHPPYLRQK